MNDTVSFPAFLTTQDVKSATGDPVDMYILHTLSMYTVHGLGLKDVALISPNIVSAAGVVVTLMAATCIWYTKKWPAALLWVVALYLDCLDGDLARAKRNLHGFSNDYSSNGYVIDVSKDILCGFIMHIAMFKHVVSRNRASQRSPASPTYSNQVLSAMAQEDEDVSLMVPAKTKTTQKVIWRCVCSLEFRLYLAFALQSLARSGTWDHIVHAYHDLLETDTLMQAQGGCKSDAVRFAALQLAVFSSSLCRCLFILWRFSAAVFYTHITWVAYLSDKLNDLMWLSLRYGWTQLLALLVATLIHISSARTPLVAFASTSCIEAM